MVQAFALWRADWYEYQKAKLKAEARRASGQLADETRLCYDLERQVDQMRAELAAVSAERDSLRKHLPALVGAIGGGCGVKCGWLHLKARVRPHLKASPHHA